MNMGFIGLGQMGRLFFEKLGWPAYVHDPLAKTEKGVILCSSAEEVFKNCPLVLYSLPLSEYGAVTSHRLWAKDHHVILSQGAVKTLEARAFGDFSCAVHLIHPMHGPRTPTHGEYLIRVDLKSTPESQSLVGQVLAPFKYQEVRLPGPEAHDQDTAETQVMTHYNFLSMGLTWRRRGIYPWENPVYQGGLDDIKALLALRIFSGPAHVYGDIAMENPFSLSVMKSYLEGAHEIFRSYSQPEVFRSKILDLKKSFLKEGAFLTPRELVELKRGSSPALPNTHLSLLAMALSWKKRGVSPAASYSSKTPSYRIRLGLVQALFSDEKLLDSCVTAAQNIEVQKDDLAFLESLEVWMGFVKKKDREGFHGLYHEVRSYFAQRIQGAVERTDQLILNLKSGD